MTEYLASVIDCSDYRHGPWCREGCIYPGFRTQAQIEALHAEAEKYIADKVATYDQSTR